MTRKKKLRDKVTALLLMAVMAAAFVPAGLLICSDEAEAATTYSYTIKRPSVKINGHKVHVVTFTVGSQGLKGTCCQAGTTAKAGKTTVKKISNTDLRAKLIYYYGYQKGYLGKANKNGFLLGRSLSWAGGNTTTYPATKAEVKNFIKAMPSNVSVPNRFEVYFCNPSNGSQNFVAYKMNPPAYITLNKTSTDKFSTAAGSGYSFAGIEYTVYTSSGAVAGKLTCKANGTTNKLTLDTGTYTVRETKTNSWYKLNPQVYTKTLTAGQTWTIGAKDSPQTGTVHIKKRVTGNYEGSLAFDFRLTNTVNSAIVYNVRTDIQTGEASLNVIEGNYRCEEVLPEDTEIADMTGPQTGLVKIGETYTFERENKALSSGMLQISKSTDDGGPLGGFRFQVSGVLFNQGHLTEEEFLEATVPELKDYDEDMYTSGDWKVSNEDLDELNEAAEGRQTGSREVSISNELKYQGDEGKSPEEILEEVSDEDLEKGSFTIKKGTLISCEGKTYKAAKDVTVELAPEEEEASEESSDEETNEGAAASDTEEAEDAKAAEEDDSSYVEKITELLTGDDFKEVDTSDIKVTAKVKVDLKPVDYVFDEENPESSGYETDTDKQIKNRTEKKENKEDYSLEYSDFDWHGSATAYQEISGGKMTGRNEVVLTTGPGGTAPAIEEGITYGRFTVKELMTDDQAARYRQPEAQTKEIRQQNGQAAFLFSFENKARWTGVQLKKTSQDGIISGITFRLEGTSELGTKIDIEAITDDDGWLDFGRLYPGEYVISEKDFDPEKYENNYKLEGYDVPAQKLVITGDETENVIVDFANTPLKSLYLTKVDKESGLFLKNSVFALYEDGVQLALFRIVQDDYGQAGIEMINTAEGSGLHASKPQVSLFPEEDETAEVQSGTTEYDEEEITIIEPDTGSEGESDGTEADGDEGDGEDESQAEEKPSSEYNFAVIRGLKEGKTYTLKEITAPTGYAASINYSFEFTDGQKLVLENAAPEIATSAADKATGMQMSDAEGMVTIIDTVSYSNLGPGHKYLMSGVLAVKPEGDRTVEQIEQDAEIIEIVKDAKGREVTAQKEFVPESENGTVDIEFKFDGSLLDGKHVVAMEQLVDPALTGVEGTITVVASHEDLEDEAQSIYFPAVSTSATADDTGKRITEADSEVTITDTVDYSNVIAGKIYEITGTLMDKETSKPVIAGGKAVTLSVMFRADKEGPVFPAEGEELKETADGGTVLTSGRVQLKFTFDASALNGRQAVVFEKLTTGGKLVGEHSDINDDAQTVSLPAINTTASTNGTDTVSDKVDYKGLIPGEKYVMKGVLMDKSTGKELLLNGNTVTAQKEFVPEAKDGSITIDFPVSVKDLRGKTAVVFETCSIVNATEEGPAEVRVISHEDINNKAQTVTFSTPQTGQPGWMLMIPAGFMTVAAILLVLRRLRKVKWIL